MTTDDVMKKATADFEKAINHLRDEFARLQVGRANPILVEGISVEMYGVSQPLKALASISIPEPRSIVIQPWDRGALAPIEKGIVGAGIGLNPVNDGVVIRINIPPLTEERRKELVKRVNSLAEEARIAIRTSRKDAIISFKEMEKTSELTEDDLHLYEKKLQDKVDEVNKRIDELSQTKEKDIMTV